MSDLKQTVDGDLDLTNGSLTIVSGADEVVQRIRQALRTFRGEWYLDITEGIPYYEDIFQKNPNPRVAEDAFKRAIIAVPGVIELLEFALLVDKATRKAQLHFRVQTEEGERSVQEVLAQ